jgi:phage I-like protein
MDRHDDILALSGAAADTLALAPVDFSDGAASPPAEFLLVRYGDNAFTKGGESGRFAFGEADADEVVADFARRGKDGVIDYEHQTLSGGEAPAAGWIKALVKTAEGLVAKVDWTARAAERLKGREYRYHSPVLHIRDGRPYRLHSVALTNHPALHGYPALVADDDKPMTLEATPMNEHLKKIATMLGVTVVALADGKEDEKATAEAVVAKLNGQTAALLAAQAATADLLKLHDCKTTDELTLKIKGMVPAAEKSALEAKLAKIEAEKAVAKAFTDGKLIEAQREWATKLAEKDLAAFTDFAAKAPKIVPGLVDPALLGNPSKSTDGAPKSFTDAEMKVFKTLNLTDEQIAKMKEGK